MELIKKAKSDPHAFGELYEAHVEAVYQFIAFRVNSVKDAEDLTSLIWEKAFQKISRLRSDEDLGFKCWLFKIARNALTDHYRTRKKGAELESESAWIDHQPNPKEEAESTFKHEEIKRLIESLPKKQRETVILSLYCEYKNKEIAMIQSISEKTVASNLSRGLSFLKLHLEKLQ